MVCLDRLVQGVMSDWSHLSVNIVCLPAQKHQSPDTFLYFCAKYLQSSAFLVGIRRYAC